MGHTAENGPKLTPDDYKADLDAVNLSARLRFQKDGNAIKIMNRYYSGITDGTGNRAGEFATNIGQGDYKEGIKILKGQAQRHDEYISNHNDAEHLFDIMKETPLTREAVGDTLDKFYVPEEVWEERNKIVRNFIHSIETGQNEYVEYEDVNEQFAETGEYKNE